MYCPHSKILIKRLLHFWGLASLQLGQVESTEMNRDKVHKMWWKTQHPKELVVLQCRLCITECKTWCRVRWSREKRICRRGGRGKPGVGQSSVQWKTPRSKFGSRQALKLIGWVSLQSARVLTCIFPIALSSSRLCSPPSTCTLNYLTFVTFLHLQGFWAKMSQPWLIGCVFFLVLFCFSFLVFLSFLSFCLSFLAFIWETVLKSHLPKQNISLNAKIGRNCTVGQGLKIICITPDKCLVYMWEKLKT